MSRSGDSSIASALERLRLIVALVVVSLSARDLQGALGVEVLASVGGGLLVASMIPIERLMGRRVGVAAASAVTVIVDSLVVLVVLGIHGTQPSDPVVLLLVLPLLEAGFRHGVFGVIATWLLMSLAILGRVAITWDGTPSQVREPTELVVLLVLVALPAAAVCEHLAERVRRHEVVAAAADRRSITLTRLARITAELGEAPPGERDRVLVAGVRRITGHDAAVHHPGSIWEEPGSIDERTVRQFDLGGRRRLACTFPEGVDEHHIESIEVIVSTARRLDGYPEAAPPDPVDPAPSVVSEPVRTLPPIRTASRPIEREVALADVAPRGPASITDVLRSELRDGDARLVVVVLVGLDNLTLVRELHGGDVAGLLLDGVAKRLGVLGGTVGRLGEEELLVVCPVDGFTAATKMKSVVQRSLERPIDVGPAGATTPFYGVGVAVHEVGATARPDDLLRRATADMFADKREQNRRFLDEAATEIFGDEGRSLMAVAIGS